MSQIHPLLTPEAMKSPEAQRLIEQAQTGRSSVVALPVVGRVLVLATNPNAVRVKKNTLIGLGLTPDYARHVGSHLFDAADEVEGRRSSRVEEIMNYSCNIALDGALAIVDHALRSGRITVEQAGPINDGINLLRRTARGVSTNG
jgi:hypothetical protein